MSTQYRKADCQSTKNVMGDKGVDPQSGPAGVSLGFKTQPEHAYLGHFRNEKFLREGHNLVPRTRRSATLAGDVVETAGRRLAARAITSGGPLGDVVAASRPVLAAKLAARAAGVTGSDRRAAIQAARRDPESARSERGARRRSRAAAGTYGPQGLS